MCKDNLMKIQLYCILIALVLCSCEPRIDNDLRVEIVGRLTDASDNALTNRQVNIFTFKPGDTRRSILFGIPIIDEDLFLGTGMTDENGDFDLTSLNRNGFSLGVVNEDGSTEFLGGFEKDPSEVNNRFDFGQVIVGETTKLIISFTNTTSTILRINYTVELTGNVCGGAQGAIVDTRNGSCIRDIEVVDNLQIRPGINNSIELLSIVGRQVKVTYQEAGSTVPTIIDLNEVSPNTVVDVVL